MRINDLPSQLKPREKANMYGIDYLTNVELLAIIIGNGVVGSSALEISADIISEYDSLTSLSKIKKKDLMKVYGLSEVKTLQILAVFALLSRIEAENMMSKNHPHTGKEMYERFKSFFDAKTKEELVVVSINRKGAITRCNALYKGREDELSVSTQEILKEVTLGGQSSFYLIHNHIDGGPSPSENDIDLTIKIREEAKKLKLNFIDHIIVTRDSYYSFKENDI